MTQKNDSDSRQVTLFLYGRETCHLCHDMWADIQLLRQKNGWVFELVWQDIEEDAVLQTQYDLRIPVLTTTDHHVICEGRLNPDQLRLWLESQNSNLIT